LIGCWRKLLAWARDQAGSNTSAASGGKLRTSEAGKPIQACGWAVDAAAVAKVAAAVVRRIGIEPLDVIARPRHAEAIAVAWHRREVEHHHGMACRRARGAAS
jgi:hypothetical protein